MTQELVRKKTLDTLREYFVGTNLAIIRGAFEAADIKSDPNVQVAHSGQRRSLVEQYYVTLD